MNQFLWTRRRAAALLAGLIVTVAATAPVRAYEPALDPDLAFVPPDSGAFVTVRAADLAGKLGIKDGKHPLALLWQQKIGIPLHHVERCTLVYANGIQDENPACLIIRTNAPCKHADVLAACAPEAREEKFSRKVCHVSPNNIAVHFAAERVVVIGAVEAVKKCLADLTKSRTGAPTFTDALALTGKHDAILWCHAQPTNACGAIPSRPFAAPTPTASRNTVTPSGSERTVTIARKPSLEVVKEGAASSMPSKEETTGLGFLPFPLPSGVEAGTIVVDIGERLNVELRMHCADEAGATKAEKVLRALVGLGRATLLAAVSEMDLLEATPALMDRDDFAGVPTKLLRLAEKGMQDAEVRTDGKTGIVSVSLPVDTKTLRAEIAKVLCLSDAFGSACFPRPSVEANIPNGSLPSGQYIDPQSPYGPPGTPPVPPYYSTIPPTMPPAPTWNPPPITPLGTPVVVTPAATAPRPAVAPPAPETLPVKLTVANVRKETALLFSVGDNGKLTFVQKIPAGEAIDVQTNSGQSWVAVFTDNPAGETFKPKQANETWLLRSEPKTVSNFGETR